MARGITEPDVHRACDALLLAGERPTIERVRLSLGRGSPNTVSPMLDAWFRQLGPRLQGADHRAQLPGVPEDVAQALAQCWHLALGKATQAMEQRLVEGLAALTAERDAAHEQARAAQAERQRSDTALAQLQAHSQALQLRLEEEGRHLVACSTERDLARRQVLELQTTLRAAEAQREADAARWRQDVEAAHVRANGAERRAALEIDSERGLRSRAERRADALERKLDSELQQGRQALARHATELAEAQAQAQRAEEGARTARAQAALVPALQQRVAELQSATRPSRPTGRTRVPAKSKPPRRTLRAA